MPALNIKSTKNNVQPYRNKLENRYSQFLSSELDQMRKETNEFDESGVHDKDKMKRKNSANSS